MHAVAGEDQVPHDLDDAGGVAEAVAGDVVGEDEAVTGRRHAAGLLRLQPHSSSSSSASSASSGQGETEGCLGGILMTTTTTTKEEGRDHG